MRGRTVRLAPQGVRTMHPDILKALMDERDREAREVEQPRRLLRRRAR
ncbi:hypothetical protein GCM10023195_53190 [Actinoallomurus liliacearum]|uniref:Uncharacterized protein n=1 Tax=Actinoallomurus liliacearum TaxID=1080073 RepID=A0ABP8TQS0_9ACTN